MARTRVRVAAGCQFEEAFPRSHVSLVSDRTVTTVPPTVALAHIQPKSTQPWSHSDPRFRSNRWRLRKRKGSKDPACLRCWDLSSTFRYGVGAPVRYETALRRGSQPCRVPGGVLNMTGVDSGACVAGAFAILTSLSRYLSGLLSGFFGPSLASLKP